MNLKFYHKLYLLLDILQWGMTPLQSDIFCFHLVFDLLTL